MHFTRTCSSWLNQVELWFGKIERDVIARGVFTSVSDVKRKLMRYIRQCNKAPRTVKSRYADPSQPQPFAGSRAFGELDVFVTHGITKGLLSCFLIAMALISLSAPGCAFRSVSKNPPVAPTFEPVATVQDIMDAQVDPSADKLWDAVAITSTAASTETRQPHTDQEWSAVRRSALTLVEATALLAMPKRRIGISTGSEVSGELTSVEIQLRVDRHPVYFAQFAYALRLASLNALKAIDARDAHALMDAGGLIDQACEACHLSYWYPPK